MELTPIDAVPKSPILSISQEKHLKINKNTTTIVLFLALYSQKEISKIQIYLC
jgi:hypothetical protein